MSVPEPPVRVELVNVSGDCHVAGTSEGDAASCDSTSDGQGVRAGTEAQSGFTQVKWQNRVVAGATCDGGRSNLQEQ